MKIVPQSALVLALLSTLLAGCGERNFEDSLKEAEKYSAKGEYRAAVIELKNALEKAPGSAVARFNLGKVLELSGDLPGALVEFNKAEELGYQKNKIAAELAQIYLQQQQYRKVIDKYGSFDDGVPEIKADVMASVGLAQLGLKEDDAAGKTIAAAVALNPRSERAQLALASLNLQAGDPEKALAVVDKLLSASPNFSRGWVMKGELLGHYLARPEEALAALQQALNTDKNSLGAYGGLISLNLAAGKMDVARQYLDLLRKKFPAHSLTAYYSSLIALKSGNLPEARTQIDKLLKLTPGEPRALELAGAVELQLGGLLQAQKYLEQSVFAWPESRTGRMLLVRTYLNAGNADKALSVLQPLLSQPTVDASAQALAGEAFLQRGDVAKAEGYFEVAAKQNPKDLRSKTALAFVHIERGHPEQGFDELKELASADKDDSIYQALINAYLKRGEFDKALASVDALERKQPQQPDAPALRGSIELARGNVAAARASFERALSLRPDHFVALVNLANLDVKAGDFGGAIERVSKVLSKYPGNADLEATLIALRRDSGVPPAELLPALQGLMKKYPGSLSIRQALIATYVDNADVKGALGAAQEGLSRAPDSPEMLDAVGRMQAALGDTNQAASSFSRWAALQPKSALPFMRLGQMYVSRADYSSAAGAFKKALGLEPKNYDAMLALVKAYADEYKLADAYSFAKQVRSSVDDGLGNALLGEIESRQGNWGKAAEVYVALLKQQSNQVSWAIKLHHALILAGKASEAQRVESGWRASHPRDGRFVEYLAGEAVLKADWPRAEQLFSDLTKTNPNNAGALNNLAWVLGKQHKPDAVPMALKAVKLQPREATYWDTLASLQSAGGDVNGAVESAKKAAALDPGTARYRLALAELLLKGGDRKLAKKELDWLNGLGEKFDGHARVKELLAGF